MKMKNEGKMDMMRDKKMRMGEGKMDMKMDYMPMPKAKSKPKKVGRKTK